MFSIKSFIFMARPGATYSLNRLYPWKLEINKT